MKESAPSAIHDVELQDINQALIALADDDHQAFTRLYLRFWPLVYNEAYRKLQCTNDAENITQDVFVTLWEGRKNLQIQNIEAYLFITTKHKTLNFIRKKRPELIAEYNNEVIASSSPLANLLYKEASQKLDRIILALPTQQRTVFSLRYIKDMPTDEIAAELGLSVKTVRNHLGKALIAIKSLVKVLFIYFHT